MRTHQGALWRYVRFLGAPPAVADDLTQETFLLLLTHAPEDRGSVALARWLRTSARRLFLNQRLRARFEVVQPTDPELEEFWEEHAGPDYIDAVRSCIATLPEQDARAIQMRYRDDADRTAIAKVLGLTTEGVKTRLRRIKERLRRCVARRIQTDD